MSSTNSLRDAQGSVSSDADESACQLRLYVAAGSPRSTTALDNLRRLCAQHLCGKYQLEVIDILQNPQLAIADQIVAVPTLVRRHPPPIRKIVGDLSRTERVLVGLDWKPRTVEPG